MNTVLQSGYQSTRPLTPNTTARGPKEREAAHNRKYAQTRVYLLLKTYRFRSMSAYSDIYIAIIPWFIHYGY